MTTGKAGAGRENLDSKVTDLAEAKARIEAMRRLDLQARRATREASEALLVGSRDAMKSRADLLVGGGTRGSPTAGDSAPTSRR